MYTLCEWRNDQDMPNLWKLNRGATPLVFTGPMADHTTDSSNGVYIYIESGSPYMNNDAAHLLSPYVAVNRTSADGTGDGDGDGVCFTFYYHMYGMDINQLNVYVQWQQQR